MLRIAPDQATREEFALTLDEICRRGAERMLAVALEAEVEAHLERQRAWRDEAGRAQVVRNGHARTRQVVTAAGAISVSAPRVDDRRIDPATGERERFRSSILPPYVRRSPKVVEVLPLLYLHGLSSKDFVPALAEFFGTEAGLSASAITRLTKSWSAELEAFMARDLSAADYVYVWVDGIHFSVRLGQDDRLCVLVVVGVRVDGTKELVALADGYRESAESWAELLRDCRRRGMRAPVLATGDGALAFWSAARDVFPETAHQRDWVHKAANVLDALPASVQATARRALREIWDAEDRLHAERALDRFCSDYEYDCNTRICPSVGRGERGVWGIDPAATEPTPRQLPGELGTPVGWSSDGTELLVIRRQGHFREGGLIILHSDGTETSLLGPMGPRDQDYLSAAISPDGSRVAYTAETEDRFAAELYVMDVDSGRTTLLVEPSIASVYQPTFSPDGTQIAYVDGGGDHSHSVWVVNADGTDPHMIVKNKLTWGLDGGHVFGLAWSPTGDRIALGLRRLPAAGIYTFAPDGSGFTRLIRDGLSPSWSPDGSQIAYESYVMLPCPETLFNGDVQLELVDPDSCWSADASGGLGVADADGSHAHTFGVGGSGPWHPASSWRGQR